MRSPKTHPLRLTPPQLQILAALQDGWEVRDRLYGRYGRTVCLTKPDHAPQYVQGRSLDALEHKHLIQYTHRCGEIRLYGLTEAGNAERWQRDEAQGQPSTPGGQ